MNNTEGLTDKQYAVLRFISVNGSVEQAMLLDRLSKRILFNNEDVSPVLCSLKEAGLASCSEIESWSLEETGKLALRNHVQHMFSEIMQVLRDKVWPDFQRLDLEMKSSCSMWLIKKQEGANSPNLHDDPEYDFSVIEQLTSVNSQLNDLFCANGVEQYFSGHLQELSTTMDKILEGEFELVTGFNVNSYHNLWTELHEDLLNAFGLERTT